ncbi:response regulator [Terriglobus roseus]|uniref:Response regulator receiver protein n=1 Tax=Terriglobus roseus TaxID=392734 RepID=A0A1H4J7J8_9BACT|nr:response regulator [Terriglobus roseus]SEB42181.1 response regulator receiver protein [Terriglobus roseus]
MIATCLIADGAALARELLRSILEDMGFDLMEAANGEQVVRLAILFPPHVIVMDMDLAKKNGLEVIATLRRHAAFKETPIIAMTCVSAEHHPARLRQAGFTDVLVKPIRPAALRSLLQTVLAP